MAAHPVDRWNFVLDEETKILFVDDDLILAEFARVHLSTPTTTVDFAANGREAWERLEKEPFDLLLLDIEMPELDGFGLLERLRGDARFEQLPIVMLTAREDIVSIDRAFQLGANSFVTKPINWRQLSYALRYVLRTTRIEADLIKERSRSDELLTLTNNLLSLIRVEARTPLSAIIGFSDCITQEIDGPIGVRSYLNYAGQIDAAARRLQDDFMDLIQYAQLTSGAAKLSEDEYLIGKLIDGAIAGTPLESRTGGCEGQGAGTVYLTCDLRWLARALKHLIEVAIRQAGAEQAKIEWSATADGGVNISIGAKAPIAARSLSIESAGHGMGIGVSFARCVIELHQGQLTIREREDGGTSMDVLLPARRVQSDSRQRSVEAA